MATTWTDEQLQVIETRHKNLLVSAAAGSGKTAVLVERIIRMITDPDQPVDIDRLLVMTFTNAAARGGAGACGDGSRITSLTKTREIKIWNGRAR